MNDLDTIVKEIVDLDWAGGELGVALLLALGYSPFSIAAHADELLGEEPNSDFCRALVGASPDAPPDVLVETLFDLLAAEYPVLGNALRGVYNARHTTSS